MANTYLEAVLRAIAAVEGIDPAGIDPDTPMHQLQAPGWSQGRRRERIWRLAAAELGVAVEPIWSNTQVAKARLPEATMDSLALLGAVSSRARALLAANTLPDCDYSPASIAESLRNGQGVPGVWRGPPVHQPWSRRRAAWTLLVWLMVTLIVLPGAQVGFGFDCGGCGPQGAARAFGLGLLLAVGFPLVATGRGLGALWRAR